MGYSVSSRPPVSGPRTRGVDIGSYRRPTRVHGWTVSLPNDFDPRVRRHERDDPTGYRLLPATSAGGAGAVGSWPGQIDGVDTRSPVSARHRAVSGRMSTVGLDSRR